jgi:hypothetical protein
MYSPSRELDKAITAICKAITKEAEKDIKDKDMDEFIANVNRISLQVIRQITGRMREYEKFAIKSYRKTPIRFSNYDQGHTPYLSGESNIAPLNSISL